LLRTDACSALEILQQCTVINLLCHSYCRWCTNECK